MNNEQILIKLEEIKRANKEQKIKSDKLRSMTKTDCKCGGRYSLSDRSKHFKTILHRNFIKNAQMVNKKLYTIPHKNLYVKKRQCRETPSK